MKINMVLYKAHCFLSSLPWKLSNLEHGGWFRGTVFPKLLAGPALVVTWDALGLRWAPLKGNITQG